MTYNAFLDRVSAITVMRARGNPAPGHPTGAARPPAGRTRDSALIMLKAPHRYYSKSYLCPESHEPQACRPVIRDGVPARRRMPA